MKRSAFPAKSSVILPVGSLTEQRQLGGAAARHRKPRTAAAKSRDSCDSDAFVLFVKDPGHAVRLQDCKVRRSAVPYTARTKCKQLRWAAARH